jgi:hypothetical protein
LVAVTDTTRIEGPGDVTLTFDDLMVGMHVFVHGIVVGEHSVIAVLICVEAEEGGGDDGTIPPGSLSAGDFVDLRALSNGELVIREAVTELENRFDYEASVEAISGPQITLLGVDFTIDGETEVRPLMENEEVVRPIMAGDRVSLTATYDPGTGNFHADRIAWNEPTDDFVRVRATVFSNDSEGGVLVVGGATFNY